MHNLSSSSRFQLANKMMSCKTFAKTIVLFFLVFLNGSITMGLRNNNELWNQDEMAQIAGYGEEGLSTVLVTGTILCHAPSNHAHSRPISGALVGVSCKGKGKAVSWAQGVTDTYGDFMINLPSHLHANLNLHKICFVRVVRLPNNKQCRPSGYKASPLKLSSFGNGIRTYTAGEIKYHHFSSKSLRAGGRDQISAAA